MKGISGAEAFIQDVLGKEAALAFSQNMEDFSCYARSVALTDLDSANDSIRKRFESISDGIITESIKVYLSENFASENGKLEIDAVDGIIYDKNMKPIPAISMVKQHRQQVLKEVLDSIMAEFSRGRKLAKEIVARMEPFIAPQDEVTMTEVASRDYRKNPPLEVFEVEVMRIENKLPDITVEEGKRLSYLYSLLKEI